MAELVLASRGSDLALVQTRMVQEALRSHGHHSTVLRVSTRGDRSASAGGALDQLAATAPGVFTADLAGAVTAGDADAAVHSFKDLPLAAPAGLAVVAVLPRAPAGDVLLIGNGHYDPDRPLGLAAGARVGTSSPRRVALLRWCAPQARPVPIRGNVPTRIERCRDGGCDAVILAAAGLARLGEQLATALAELTRVELPVASWLPAPAQGAIAIQGRRDSTASRHLAALDHAETRTAVELERRVLAAAGGGCGTALGAYAQPGDHGWVLDYGFAGELEGAGGAAQGAAGAGWRRFRLHGSRRQCESALAAWTAGGPPAGTEQSETVSVSGAGQGAG